MGTSLVVPWLRPRAPNEGDPGSILGQGIRFHMPQERPGADKINKYFKSKKNPITLNSCSNEYNKNVFSGKNGTNKHM